MSIQNSLNQIIGFVGEYYGCQHIKLKNNHAYLAEIVEIIMPMSVDNNVMIAVLLHDILKGIEYRLVEIRDNFSLNFVKSVNDVEKLSKVNFFVDHIRLVESFYGSHKLLLTIVDDVRARRLLIKFASLFYSLCTTHSIQLPQKHQYIFLKIVDIYMLLVKRVAIEQIIVILQDICFYILEPVARSSIINHIQLLLNSSTIPISEVINQLSDILSKSNIVARVSGRLKTPHSIWMKMKKKNVDLAQISDIIAFRIIVNDIEECYKTLNIVHNQYVAILEHFQDFISAPKENGYQSLHTVVISPFKQQMEVQIRTQEMHDEAEYGNAAHWEYKYRDRSLIYKKLYNVDFIGDIKA